MAERGKTAEGIVSTLLLVASNPGIKSKEIAKILNVSTRTALRHIDRLRKMGLEIDSSTGPSGGLKVRWQYFLRPLVFTGSEAVALFLAARVFTTREGFPYRDSLRNALEKISKAFATDQERDYFKMLEPKLSIVSDWIRDYLPWENHIGSLCEAARACREVEMVYDSAASEQKRSRKVNPYHMLLKDGAWYLVAYCHERKELRTFRVDRIKSMVVTEAIFDEPDFDLEEYFKNSWQLARGKPVRVRIHVIPPMARYIFEGDWHPSEVKEEQPDGSVILTVTVEETWEIKKWILGWGGHALVLEPEHLRDEIVDELETLLQRYRSNRESNLESSIPGAAR